MDLFLVPVTSSKYYCRWTDWPSELGMRFFQGHRALGAGSRTLIWGGMIWKQISVITISPCLSLAYILCLKLFRTCYLSAHFSISAQFMTKTHGLENFFWIPLCILDPFSPALSHTNALPPLCNPVRAPAAQHSASLRPTVVTAPLNNQIRTTANYMELNLTSIEKRKTE